MTKFGVDPQDHASFIAIKDDLTARLAAVIEAKLIEMGEDIKGVSWFSSAAEQYALSKRLAA